MKHKKRLAVTLVCLMLSLSGCAEESDLKEEDMVMKEWESTNVYSPIHIFLL